MNNSDSTSKFEAWIFKSFNPNIEALGLYRIFCSFFILLFLLPDINRYFFLSSLPNDFFVPPPGPMMLFEGFPPHLVFLVIHGLLVFSLLLMAAGWKTVKTSLLSGLLLLILNGFIYSAGKINHDLLVIVVPMLMAFSGWGSAYSIDSYMGTAKRKAQGWPLTLLAFIIGFMFFTAGFSKIIGGWLNLDSQAALGHFFNQYFVKGRSDLLAGYALEITNLHVWELFDYATVLFEVGFLLAVFYSRAIRLYMCMAVIFHFCTMVVMNISFLPNFLAYAAFLNWNLINEGCKDSISKISSSKKYARLGPPVLIAAVLLFVFITSDLIDGGRLLTADWGMQGIIIVGSALPVVVYYLSVQLVKLFKS